MITFAWTATVDSDGPSDPAWTAVDSALHGLSASRPSVVKAIVGCAGAITSVGNGISVPIELRVA